VREREKKEEAKRHCWEKLFTAHFYVAKLDKELF
jgi:hypothetical protein